ELAKWSDNKRVTSIWVANADGSGGRKFLGHEKDRNAVWSPDGRFIAFLAERDGGEAPAQIWLLPADGGEATRLTDPKRAIRAFDWAKDNASIVFTAEPAKSDAEKKSEKAGEDAIVVDDGANGQERGQFTGLWRVIVADKTEKAITHDPSLLIESFRLSPDNS